MVMIDKEKWEQSSTEQKMQMCNAIHEGANERAVSKEDFVMMFKFLLEVVQVKQ